MCANVGRENMDGKDLTSTQRGVSRVGSSQYAFLLDMKRKLTSVEKSIGDGGVRRDRHDARPRSILHTPLTPRDGSALSYKT